ncbi:hypothetical protein [Parafilimonas sp.]|uniref:hypothetical protein n=1 Tax=Parafilimonas sp. TaxID=1969739 RepID=UPI0039E4B68C
MKTNATQKEILLVTNNSFAQREWCSKEACFSVKMTVQEQMEEICANGLICEVLPEVFEGPENSRLYLWQMRPGFSFIQLQYGEFPLEIKKATSLDPRAWLGNYCYN